jgi:hypothetical protein
MSNARMWSFDEFLSNLFPFFISRTVKNSFDWWGNLIVPNRIDPLGKVKKRKVIPVTGREGPWSCETPRLSHYLDNRLTDGGKVVSLTRPLPFTSQEDSWYSFLLRAWVDTRAIVRLEGLGKLKKSIDLNGNGNRDLSACSVAPKPTTLPRAPDTFGHQNI